MVEQNKMKERKRITKEEESKKILVAFAIRFSHE